MAATIPPGVRAFRDRLCLYLFDHGGGVEGREIPHAFARLGITSVDAGWQQLEQFMAQDFIFASSHQNIIYLSTNGWKRIFRFHGLSSDWVLDESLTLARAISLRGAGHTRQVTGTPASISAALLRTLSDRLAAIQQDRPTRLTSEAKIRAFIKLGLLQGWLKAVPFDERRQTISVQWMPTADLMALPRSPPEKPPGTSGRAGQLAIEPTVTIPRTRPEPPEITLATLDRVRAAADKLTPAPHPAGQHLVHPSDTVPWGNPVDRLIVLLWLFEHSDNGFLANPDTAALGAQLGYAGDAAKKKGGGWIRWLAYYRCIDKDYASRENRKLWLLEAGRLELESLVDRHLRGRLVAD